MNKRNSIKWKPNDQEKDSFAALVLIAVDIESCNALERDDPIVDYNLNYDYTQRIYYYMQAGP